jgi:hypothetical protein
MCIKRSREEEISKHVWRLGGVYVCLLLPRSLSAPLQSVEMSSSFFFLVLFIKHQFQFQVQVSLHIHSLLYLLFFTFEACHN